jgi:hypothetical protein
MKTFMLILSIVTTDPSRPTVSRVVYTDLTGSQCRALMVQEYWDRNARGETVVLRCELAKQVG